MYGLKFEDLSCHPWALVTLKQTITIETAQHIVSFGLYGRLGYVDCCYGFPTFKYDCAQREIVQVVVVVGEELIIASVTNRFCKSISFHADDDDGIVGSDCPFEGLITPVKSFHLVLWANWTRVKPLSLVTSCCGQKTVVCFRSVNEDCITFKSYLLMLWPILQTLYDRNLRKLPLEQ